MVYCEDSLESGRIAYSSGNSCEEIVKCSDEILISFKQNHITVETANFILDETKKKINALCSQVNLEDLL